MKKQRGRIPAALLALLSPLLVVLLIWAVTGTSPLHIDMWNTTWSDEVGYWRAVRLIRKYGVPQGWAGYNEVTPTHLPYSAYPVTTYLPYCFLSLFTGTEAKSYFLWCNLILAFLGLFIWILLAKPDRRQCLMVALFFITNLILGRYIWSGMAEASYIFYMVVMCGLSMRYSLIMRGGSHRYSRGRRRQGEIRARERQILARGKRRSRTFIIVMMVILTAFWSMIRPYFMVMYLLPVGLILSGQDFRTTRKAAGTIATVAVGAVSWRIYSYLNANYCAKYFGGGSVASKFLALVGNGSISDMARRIFLLNRSALSTVLEFAQAYRWAGLVTILFALEWILLLITWIRRLYRSEHDGSGVMGFVLLLLGLLIYEATAVLYNPAQLHRMLLAVTVSYALYIIIYGKISAWLNEAAVLAIMAPIILHAKNTLALPQTDAQSISGAERQQLEIQFEELIPLSEEPWDNTVVKNTNGDDYRTTFLLPAYASVNVCREENLDDRIENSTLNSRYLLTLEEDDVNELCAARPDVYTVIWQGYGRILYRRADDGNVQN